MHVIGIAPPDDQWKRMRAVWDACEEANVQAPDEVVEFFNGREPEESGVRIDLDQHDCVSKYNAEMKDGFEVDLRKVPANVQIIRFYNSY